MMRYSKTAKGLHVLQHRNVELNARQRRLLVLIGTEDFDLLTPQFKARIAPHDFLQQLCDIGLIEIQELETSNAAFGTESAQTSAPTNNSVKASFPHFPESNIQTSITRPASSADLEAPITTTLVATTHVPDVPADITYIALNQEQIRSLMLDSLKKYCGLLAKQHIQNIAQAPDINALKVCQVQWLTLLQESRMPSQELNQLFKQISHALSMLRAQA